MRRAVIRLTAVTAVSFSMVVMAEESGVPLHVQSFDSMVQGLVAKIQEESAEFENNLRLIKAETSSTNHQSVKEAKIQKAKKLDANQRAIQKAELKLGQSSHSQGVVQSAVQAAIQSLARPSPPSLFSSFLPNLGLLSPLIPNVALPLLPPITPARALPGSHQPASHSFIQPAILISQSKISELSKHPISSKSAQPHSTWSTRIPVTLFRPNIPISKVSPSVARPKFPKHGWYSPIPLIPNLGSFMPIRIDGTTINLFGKDPNSLMAQVNAAALVNPADLPSIAAQIAKIDPSLTRDIVKATIRQAPNLASEVASSVAKAVPNQAVGIALTAFFSAIQAGDSEKTKNQLAQQIAQGVSQAVPEQSGKIASSMTLATGATGASAVQIQQAAEIGAETARLQQQLVLNNGEGINDLPATSAGNQNNEGEVNNLGTGVFNTPNLPASFSSNRGSSSNGGGDVGEPDPSAS